MEIKKENNNLENDRNINIVDIEEDLVNFKLRKVKKAMNVAKWSICSAGSVAAMVLFPHVRATVEHPEFTGDSLQPVYQIATYSLGEVVMTIIPSVFVGICGYKLIKSIDSFKYASRLEKRNRHIEKNKSMKKQRKVSVGK